MNGLIFKLIQIINFLCCKNLIFTMRIMGINLKIKKSLSNAALMKYKVKQYWGVLTGWRSSFLSGLLALSTLDGIEGAAWKEYKTSDLYKREFYWKAKDFLAILDIIGKFLMAHFWPLIRSLRIWANKGPD